MNDSEEVIHAFFFNYLLENHGFVPEAAQELSDLIIAVCYKGEIFD